MRLHSWLKSVYRQLASPTLRIDGGRRQKAWMATSELVERLEPRRLLSAGVIAVGLETRVNSFTTGDQRSPSIAMDATGNYVAVWASVQDGGDFGVFGQRYNTVGMAQGSEFKVNTYTTANQSFPSVAMDAAGDFVVTWESLFQDGGDFGVYAQRYNAAGTVQGGEFKVNTYTTNDQTNPSVAMDSAGDFVITWQTYGQDVGSSGVYAQRYNAAGARQGGEFKVNTYTTNDQTIPAVTMDAVGDFVITWQSDGQDYSGLGIYAQRYNAAGTRQGAEFPVNTYTTGVQDGPSAAMDASGDFVITWESAGQDGSGYSIEAKRYNAAGSVQGAEFEVNTYTTNDQRSPSAAMDSAGEFVITWMSNGEDGSGYGASFQRYDAAGTPKDGEFQVNTTSAGNQHFPSAAMFAAGNLVVTWQSEEQDRSGSGIYSQRYVATVGPIVTAVLDGAGPRVVHPGDELTSSITTLSVIFTDDLNVVPSGGHSVTNRSNWRLTRYEVDVGNQISRIGFSYDAGTNRYVAVVSFYQPLIEGAYQLVARHTIQDLTGRSLDGDADGIPGGDFRRNFADGFTLTTGPETRVNSYTTGNQIQPKIAMDATGDYVVVWQSYGQDGSKNGIYAQRYNSAGIIQGGELQINTYTTDKQQSPSVTMDSAGDFVITWESTVQDSGGYGIYAQRYSAAGTVLGSEFQVNTYTTNRQNSPSVAMDAAGDFVITWVSYLQDGSLDGIYAQRYNVAGIAQGEFQVNTYTTDRQYGPSTAMDAAGDFVISWESRGEDGSDWGIYARQYDAAGAVRGAEFQVNTFTTNAQRSPSVAMEVAGDFVISWQSIGQDGNSYGVYAQRYNAAGARQGAEFKVNTYTTGNQEFPSAAVDAEGDFVIAWMSDAQDGSSFGVYAQRYSAAGYSSSDEYHANGYTTNSQDSPSVAIHTIGDFVVTWQSDQQDGNNSGVYRQRVQMDISPRLYQIEATTITAVGPLTTPVTSSLMVFDYDSNNWTGATVQISGNYLNNQDLLGFTNTAKISGSWDGSTGTLTLTGTDTVSNYRTALHNVTYHNTSGSPNTSLTRTVDFEATDGLLWSNVVSRDVTVLATSPTPILSGVNGTGVYFENGAQQPISLHLVASDPESVNLASATVSFTGWQGEDRTNFNNIFALQHTFIQDLVAHTAVFTITGLDTLDHYQTLLRSVVYWDVSDAPNTVANRVASFKIRDNLSVSSSVTRSITVVAINDAPMLSAMETTALAYKASDPAFPPLAISATLLISEPDSKNLTRATVQITAGYQNGANDHDVLSFANQLGITGSFSAATGMLTLTGTSAVGNYRTALRSVKFSSSGSVVSTANRTLTITGTDDFRPTHATSLAVTRTLTVSITNLPPAIAGISLNSLAYMRGTAAAVITPGALVYDPDSVNLTGARIQITANYQNGQDVLAFTSGFGVTGTFTTATGKLSLTGTASLANYQTLLRSLTYKTNNASANTLTRTISITINDGLDASFPVTRNVSVT